MHYDGFGDKYYIPWSYDGSNTDYQGLSSAYSSITSELSSKNVKYGTSSSFDNENIGGTLIDYALSIRSLAFQGALSKQSLSSSQIASVCSSELSNAIIFLKQLAKPLQISYLSSKISLCNNCNYPGVFSLTYQITNPSIVD